MANKGISQLQDASALTGLELVPLVQNGVTKKTTALELAALASIPVTNDITTNASLYPLFVDATSGSVSNLYTSDPKFNYNPSSGTLSATVVEATNGIFVNSAFVNTSYNILDGTNGLSGGPITIAGTATVTTTGSAVWTVAGAGGGGGGGGITFNPLYINDLGTGDASPFQFDGIAPQTISYNSVGAPAIDGTNATGTWAIDISGNAATATLATTATNIGSGAINQIAVQSAAGTTTFITAPTLPGTFLEWTGGAFIWNYPTGGGGGAVLPAPGVAGQVLTSDGTSWLSLPPPAVSTANAITGGAAYELLYQSAPGVTAFIPNGVAGQVLVSNGPGSVPTWTDINGGVF